MISNYNRYLKQGTNHLLYFTEMSSLSINITLQFENKLYFICFIHNVNVRYCY